MNYIEGLSKNQNRDVLDKAIWQYLARKEILFCEGDSCRNCYLVTKGCLKLSKLNTHGAEIIIRFVFPGEMAAAIAVLKKEVYPLTAQAVKPTKVIAWDKNDFRDLIYKYPDMGFNMLTKLFDRLENLQTRYLELSCEQVHNRIAQFMLYLIDHAGYKQGKTIYISIPLSRQNIADYIGASLFTVSRILSNWEKSGWLKSSYQKVTIMEPDALKSFK